MKTWLLLTLYLGDELLASQLPFSSGSFAIALILVAAGRSRPSAAVQQRVVLLALTAALFGAAGAWLSGTPISAFALATLVLLAAIWTCGAGLQGPRGLLLSARAAATGVLVVMVFLLLSLAGWDVFSIVSGQPSSRGVGLFLEPSHLALYLMPLWLVAHQRRRYRPWLIAALALVVVSSFSASLAVFLLVAYGLHMHSRGAAAEPGGKVRAALLVALVLALGATLPLPITIGDVPVQAYVGDRLRGLFVGDDTDAYNISSLVVLQGVELAYLSFVSSFGLGVGAGNLGLSPQVLDQSAYRELINGLTASGLDLNLRDGGILASKVAGEAGVLALAFFWLVARHLRRACRLDHGPSSAYHLAFAAALICLLFVRALPYFAAPACLAIVSLASLSPLKRRRYAIRPSALPLSP